jgi:hypothetical protein
LSRASSGAVFLGVACLSGMDIADRHTSILNEVYLTINCLRDL